jgi:glycosyltransferase involved in cell wall biosynthesis
MKVLLASDANSSHTRKWLLGLRRAGVEVALFSLSVPNDDWYVKQGMACFVPRSHFHTLLSITGKLGYRFAVSALKRALRTFDADVLHAHYASSYGWVARLSGFQPYLVSVWGSDVYAFPGNPFNASLLRKNLNAARMVFATSRHLAEATRKHTRSHVTVVPFGIPEPLPLIRERSAGEPFVFGYVKGMAEVYGTDWVLEAFAALHRTHPGVRLLMVGDGPMLESLKAKAATGEAARAITWVGRVAPDRVGAYYEKMNVLLNPSRFESFGVSILEAGANGVPSIATRVGGIPEVVDAPAGAWLIAPSLKELQESMLEAAEHPDLCREKGKAARAFVEEHYRFSENVAQQIQAYRTVLI